VHETSLCAEKANASSVGYTEMNGCVAAYCGLVVQ
jgi:hypothetical protein